MILNNNSKFERILLVGGTSDAVDKAKELLERGHWVLHSRFYESIELVMPQSSNLKERFGPLDSHGFIELIKQHSITQVYDCAHPFAKNVHKEVARAANVLHIPYLRIYRPAIHWKNHNHVYFVQSHEQAAKQCIEWRGTALITVGSRNIEIYQTALSAVNQPFYARVLNNELSLQKCFESGLTQTQIIAQRGPFTVEQNLHHIKQCGATILVTKDSGTRGGIEEKIIATKIACCKLIVVQL